MRLAMLLGLLAIASTDASAATIFIDSTAKDTVGQSLVYQLRNKIASSSLHSIVYRQADAGFVIHLTTLHHEDRSLQTVYSAVLTMPSLSDNDTEIYITSQTGYCGSDVIGKCADGILSGFDQSMSEIASAVTEALKKK